MTKNKKKSWKVLFAIFIVWAIVHLLTGLFEEEEKNIKKLHKIQLKKPQRIYYGLLNFNAKRK